MQLLLRLRPTTSPDEAFHETSDSRSTLRCGTGVLWLCREVDVIEREVKEGRLHSNSLEFRWEGDQRCGLSRELAEENLFRHKFTQRIDQWLKGGEAGVSSVKGTSFFQLQTTLISPLRTRYSSTPMRCDEIFANIPQIVSWAMATYTRRHKGAPT